MFMDVPEGIRTPDPKIYSLTLTELDATENVLFRRVPGIGTPKILSVPSHALNLCRHR
jgi:hypothetical protein